MKLRLFTLSLLFYMPPQAWADSFLPRFIGGIDPGVPTHITPTAVVTNPAALGRLKGTHLHLSWSPVLQTLKADRLSISSTTGAPGPGADTHFSAASYGNSLSDYFFGATTDFGQDRVALGIALYSPFSQDFSKPASPLRYHLTDRSISNIFFTSVLALRLHKKFHIGFGLSFVYTEINLQMIRDRFLRGDLPEGAAERYEQGGTIDEKVRINTKDSNLGFNVGFLYQIKEWLLLGGSYRSKIRSLRSDSVRTTGDGSITRWDDSLGRFETLHGSATLITTFPEIANLGIRGRLSRYWWADFTFTWTRWSDHDKMQVLLSGNDFASSSLTNWDLNVTSYRGFQDTLSPQLTFFFNQNTGFSFMTSMRYNPPATPKKWVNPAAVDNHSVDLMLSTSYQLFSFMKLQLAYTLEYMVPIKVERSGFTPSTARTCLETHIDVAWSSECRDTMNNGQALPSAAGSYTKLTHQFSLGLSMKF